MGDVDVDLNVLDQIARDLDSGAKGLEDLDGSSPKAVDAGDMKGIVLSMLAQIVDSAGNVSVSCTAAAQQVRECRRYYMRDDASAAASLSDIKKIMATS